MVKKIIWLRKKVILQIIWLRKKDNESKNSKARLQMLLFKINLSRDIKKDCFSKIIVFSQKS